MSDERRQKDRLLMHLPVQIKVESGELIDLELVDVSPRGMQVRGDTLSIFQERPDFSDQQVEFEVRVVARLAWVEAQDDGTFAIGLDLGRGDDGPRIG